MPPARATARMKLLARASRNSASMIIPGVMTRTTSRLTSPLAVAGSSTWSQTATL